MEQALEELREQFTISLEMVQKIAHDFQKEMEKGLAKEESSLKMLSSYLGNPSGQERGTFLALDFGGTNLRLLLVELLGQRRFRVREQTAFLLKDSQKGYDYTSAQTSAQELFDFIALKIARFLEGIPLPQAAYFLGYTFSFPFSLAGEKSAILLNWTKEFKTVGVEGQDVGQLLTEALRRQGLQKVVLQTILNDTVGTQLAAAYQDSNCRIGSIIGTGHNSCYLEKGTIINLEAGNFHLLPRTRYDRILDQKSWQPGSQILEKMVSGQYIGELVGLIIESFQAQELIFLGEKECFKGENLFTAQDMSVVLRDNSPNLEKVEELLRQKFNFQQNSLRERKILREICSLVRDRSAALIAATYLGIIRQLGGKKHTIAIDGSLFEKMPGYAAALTGVLQNAVAELQLALRLTKDGSGIGAAVAAAVSAR